MINPTHHLKKFVKYSGDDKPADFHVTEERGWLGSGITDCNGVEIFEGDIVKCWIEESNRLMNFRLHNLKSSLTLRRNNHDNRT